LDKFRGELALIIEIDEKGEPIVIGYKEKENGFEKEELIESFLMASMEDKEYTGDEKHTLNSYFQGKSKDLPKLEKESRELPREAALNDLTEKDVRLEAAYAGKKYKPVDQKVKPVLGTLPEEFRIIRNITGDPLADMPKLNPNPPDFEPKGRYTEERRKAMDELHNEDFMWPEERKLMHHLIAEQNEAFAWDDSERGSFKEEFFPPIEIPVVEHVPWVMKNLKIPPGSYKEVCDMIKTKIDAGVYEPSNSSYRSRWFTVVKKDGKSLRIVHSLEPLNAVTIAHSGLPPAADELAEQFSGYSCGGILDLYVGYDERKLAPKS
jgi:hypothetical protein